MNDTTSGASSDRVGADIEVGDASDIVDDGVSDVLAVADQVAVPGSVVEQVQSLEYNGETFAGDVQDWDEPDAGGEGPSSAPETLPG